MWQERYYSFPPSETGQTVFYGLEVETQQVHAFPTAAERDEWLLEDVEARQWLTEADLSEIAAAHPGVLGNFPSPLRV